jgi:hypothetical protein
LQHAARESADAHFQAIEVRNGFDFLAEPAAHLAAGIATIGGDNVEFLLEVIQQLQAAAKHHPRLVHSLVWAERNRCAESKGRILAKIIIRRGVGHLDGAVLSGVERLQARHDFSGCEDLNLKLVVGSFGDGLGKDFGPAILRVQ